jgi:hypothetical protein
MERATVIGTTPDGDLRLCFAGIATTTRAAIECLMRSAPLAP